MAKTTPMRLIELMVLKNDVPKVIAYLGKTGNFQFQNDIDKKSSAEDANVLNPDAELFTKLQQLRIALGVEDLEDYTEPLAFPSDTDNTDANRLIEAVEALHERETAKQSEYEHLESSYSEAQAFANLQVSYSELENLSFITMRLGKIDPAVFEGLKAAVGNKAMIIPLGNDKSRIMAVGQKKTQISLDAELKKYDFVEMEVSRDFKGIPEDLMDTMKNQLDVLKKELEEIAEEKQNFASVHKDQLYHLLQVYSVSSQVKVIENRLESTQLVCCITGWLPADMVKSVADEIENITDNKTGIRQFEPDEVQAVINGTEKVPVQVKHGKLIHSFERLVFSFGAPLYGTVDPTPFVALFFTLLFGIMFGDAGQGLVFLVIGILMACKLLKVGGWEKFALVFISIGVSSTIMGTLTGEFFGSTEVLAPLSRWITGLFGEPRNQILEMLPSSEPESIKRMFMFFGFSVAVGFIINSVGVIINVVNQFMMGKKGNAIFGKTGISGVLFYWSVVYVALKAALFSKPIMWYDWVLIGGTLALSAFGHTLARIINGEKPYLEHDLLTTIIEAVVEILEILSSYLSNSVSFLRVGAFALAHAVLGYIIETMAGFGNPIIKLVIFIVGNAIVVVLEGMIVSIQVIRLQYYEFFSKFFNTTGKEFQPFKFVYKTQE